MTEKRFIKPADIILVAVLLICCAAFIVPRYLSSEKPIAVVYSGKEEIHRIDLSAVTSPYTIDLQCTPKAVLTVEPGLIYYSFAACHDKLCVNCGKLSRPGDTAACLPSNTLVVIEGAPDKNSPDAITY